MACGFQSCDSWLYDDTDRCLQEIDVSFMSQTICQSEPTYPEQIRDIKLFVFDKDDILVSSYNLKNITLSPSFSFPISIKEGKYSLVAWAGVSNIFLITDCVPGKTTKKDLYIKLNRTTTAVERLISLNMFVGESKSFNVLKDDPSFMENKISINLKELTNRISIRLEGVINPEDYEISVLSDNTSYALDGTLIKENLPMLYPKQANVENGMSVTKLGILKLQTGHNSRIIITNKKTGLEIFNHDLVGIILLKNHITNINLDCVHDFDLVLTAADVNGKYIIAQIYINGWHVHSYKIDAEI